MKKDYTKTLTTRVASTFCPFCFKILDAATSFGSEVVPTAGDFTVCIQCCNVLRFGDDMSLVASSLMEIPPHSRAEFAKIVGYCKQLPRRGVADKPSPLT